jgi:hypothetical protein
LLQPGCLRVRARQLTGVGVGVDQEDVALDGRRTASPM